MSEAPEADRVVFDTKVAILVLEDLPAWQKLNVTAFLATGIAGAAPEAMGEPYEDAAGRRYAALLGSPYWCSRRRRAPCCMRGVRPPSAG